jgi:hypothetical protein
MALPFPEALRAAVVDLDTGKAWLRALIDADLSFHLEDSADTIVAFKTDEPIFTPENAELVQERVAELYELDWGVFDCPIGFMLAYECETKALDYWTVGDALEYSNGQLAEVVHADYRLAVLKLASGRFEVARRDMETSAEGSWVNPVEDEADFATLDEALAALKGALMPTMAEMCAEFDAWRDKNGIVDEGDAIELQFYEHRTSDELRWLSDFSERWTEASQAPGWYDVVVAP